MNDEWEGLPRRPRRDRVEDGGVVRHVAPGRALDIPGAGCYEDALQRFDALLAVDVSVLPDESQGPSYDAGIFGALSYDARGVCLFRLGRFAEAAQAWEAAAGAAPGDPSLAVKRDLARGRAARSPAA